MKRFAVVLALCGLLLTSLPVSASSAPVCTLSTLVIPTFGPDWILVTLTGLNPTDTYVVTLTEPNGVQIQQDQDYGQTYNQLLFDVITFQPGVYTVRLNETGRHRVLTSCSLQL